MKRNKDKRVKGRFVTMILGKYVFFSIVLVILLFVLLFAAVWNAGKYQNVPHIKELAEEFGKAKQSEYQNIDVERLLGENGYVQILDQKKQVVYSNSEKHRDESYTDYELSYVSDYNNFSIVTIEKYKNEDGSTDRMVTTVIYTEQGEEVKNALYVVDENLNILYSSEHQDKDKLTKREYELLTRNATSKYTLSKCNFKDAEGNKRILLAYCPKSVGNDLKKMKQAFLALIVEFFAVYILLLLLFSLWISVRVKKPLRLLNQAMKDLSSGNRGTILDYKGPKEFVEICDNFNEMSKALNIAEQQNQRLQEEKQKMIADISHDLKTPITVIKGYAGAICDGLATPEEQRKYLETIYQRSGELTELINEFHEYAKIDHPDNTFHFERIDLCEFTREYFAEKYNEFDIGGYELEIEIPENKIIVNLDQKKFKRVYDNITGNFLKYNLPGRTFFCTITIEDKEIKIILADDGNGIPFEIKDAVFEPFVVGEKARNQNGSGLGLPLAKKIVEGHNGSIELSKLPRQDRGTEFVIKLPYEMH